MTRIPSTLAIAVLAPVLAIGGLRATAQTPTLSYRSSVDTVLLTVSVKQRGQLVRDLTPRDFEIRDNNTVQAFEVAGPEAVPLDLTLVVDVSGSSRGSMRDSLTRAVNAIGAKLRPTDRASVVTFNQQVREVRPLTAGWTPITFPNAFGQTALFDASTAALVSAGEAGRRRMAILFTDGYDTSSFLSPSTLIDVAKRADTSLFVVALTRGTTKMPRRTPHEALFQTITETTGGTLTTLQQDQDIGGAFDRAFEDFGTSYVLRYTYKGPVRSGWHPVAVKVLRSGSYEIAVRDGYFAGE